MNSAKKRQLKKIRGNIMDINSKIVDTPIYYFSERNNLKYKNNGVISKNNNQVNSLKPTKIKN